MENTAENPTHGQANKREMKTSQTEYIQLIILYANKYKGEMLL